MRFFFDPKKLQANECVYKVDAYKLTLTYAFRKELFKCWKIDQRPSVLAAMLKEKGLVPELVGVDYPIELARSFKNSGFPRPSCPEMAVAENNLEENPLLLSGKFNPAGHNGMKITDEFMLEITSRYPEISVEESIRMAGLDPVDFGYQRIQRIKKNLETEQQRIYRQQMEKALQETGFQEDKDIEATEDAPMPGNGDENQSKKDDTLESNPYVQSVSNTGLVMKDVFYNEAHLLYRLGLEEILRIYEVDTNRISDRSKSAISAKLYHWQISDVRISENSEQICRIQRARIQAMNRLIKEGFRSIGRNVNAYDIVKSRMICHWLDQLPRDTEGFYTRKKILELAGISKSRYYAILNDDSYGISRIRRQGDEEADLALIRQVLDYKGFAKGIRQVHMLMPQLTGKELSIYRIRTLMQKNGIRTTIRRPSRNRKAMKELIERNRKSNLLLRRFRLHRPNEVRLTDVTYIDYGDGKRAYGSASIDPSTGRVICFIVSEKNDLQLALDTLEAMDQYPAKRGAIFHSDQGILYLTDEFQAAVLERELNQSMSRRGNCWDNSPQEAFFGHFKDESGYKKCQTMEELRDKVSEYALYYNEERRIWERGKMTPVEYEAWLEGMSEEEFCSYLAQEEEKYRRMKELSAEKAKKSARERRENTRAELEDINEACRS